MRVRILVLLIANALAGTVALYAIHPEPPRNNRTGQARYTTVDILEFLAFSAGPVVADHPALSAPKIAKTLPEGQERAAAERVTGCIHSIDAMAGPALTAAFNAADPLRLDNALHRIDAATNRWLKTAHTQDDPCPPPPPPPKAPPPSRPSYPIKVNGIGLWNYIVLGENFLAVWFTYMGAVALAYAALVASFVVVWVALVPILVSYQFENLPTELDRQTAIATITKAMRS
jgi:hypothetical protein